MASRRRPSLAHLVKGAARLLPLALMFSLVLWTRMEATKHLTMSTVVGGGVCTLNFVGVTSELEIMKGVY